MSYDFSSLSPADFEDLSRDLIGREMNVRFESFGPGPDGGADGRHATGGSKTILQAKHYAGSTFANLKAQLRKERPSIDRLNPERYLLTTSRNLSQSNKGTLAREIGPALRNESDIFSRSDLNGLLRKHSDIEKSHIKLWLSSASVLDRMLRHGAHVLNDITRQEIQDKVRIYAPNPSFNRAQRILEAHRVLIVSGPPGVGKTTLAEMLSYAYIAEGWELWAIRSLDDGLASIRDTKRQIFYFDDFLGKVALDHRSLSQRDSDIARFIRHVQSSSNARFILTTRAYILEDARRVSEHLADPRLNVTKYVLDVGVYTRQIRARILYNHLLVANVDRELIAALVNSGRLPSIIDHKNYNPRIIEWMTDVYHIKGVDACSYPGAFTEALDNPARLWDIAFRTHISRNCQHLLISLYFSSEYGVDVEELRSAFQNVHSYFCIKYGIPRSPKDFEDALRVLEGGFILFQRD